MAGYLGSWSASSGARMPQWENRSKKGSSNPQMTEKFRLRSLKHRRWLTSSPGMSLLRFPAGALDTRTTNGVSIRPDAPSDREYHEDRHQILCGLKL
jgi:hypothetical protein